MPCRAAGRCAAGAGGIPVVRPQGVFRAVTRHRNRRFLILPLLLAAACTPLPDTGRDPSRLGPTPPLVPLDVLLTAPAPTATPELGEELSKRGADARRDASGI